MPDESVHMAVTSPPYWALRDYQLEPLTWGDGWRGSLGLEPTPQLYIAHLVEIFEQVRRVLRRDGTLWCNIGDSYAGSGQPGYQRSADSKLQGRAHRERRRLCKQLDKLGERLGTGGGKKHSSQLSGRAPTPLGLKPKDLVGVPWMLAFALRDAGWYLRSDIIWSKPNPMPESVTDRPTKAHEYLFLLSKSERYYYDQDAIREPAIHEGRVVKAYPPDAKNLDGVSEVNDRRTASGFANHDTLVNGRNKRSVWEIATQAFSGAQLQSDHQGHEGQDAVVGGKERITSPDCPTHGGQPGQPSKGDGDGHAAECRQTRTERSATSRAAGHVGDFGSIQMHREPLSEGDNSGLPLFEYGYSASAHNIESHKTGPAPETSPSYMPFGGTGSHIDGTPGPPASDASHHGRPGSTSSEGCGEDATEIEVGETEWNRLRRCTCSYSNYTTKTDHFAVYPEKLVEPCILAGTSERGCCPGCGAPWQRIVDYHRDGKDWRSGDMLVKGRGAEVRQPDIPRNTIGWEPTCKCGHEDTVPGTVLDCFAGTSTTGVVAQKLGRRGIMIEASLDYLALSKKRLATVSLPMYGVESFRRRMKA